jgi:hypothetical protein
MVIFFNLSCFSVLCFTSDLASFEEKARVNSGGFSDFNIQSKTVGPCHPRLPDFCSGTFGFETFAAGSNPGAGCVQAHDP